MENENQYKFFFELGCIKFRIPQHPTNWGMNIFRIFLSEEVRKERIGGKREDKRGI